MLILQLLVTAYLTGLIWTIQAVHYPTFAAWAPSHFREWHAFHQRRLGALVGGPMVAELALAAHSLWPAPAGLAPASAVGGFLLVVGIWGSTALIQVPLHRRLAAGWDPVAIRRLERTNWLRTVAWTARLALLTSAAAMR